MKDEMAPNPLIQEKNQILIKGINYSYSIEKSENEEEESIKLKLFSPSKKSNFYFTYECPTSKIVKDIKFLAVCEETNEMIDYLKEIFVGGNAKVEEKEEKFYLELKIGIGQKEKKAVIELTKNEEEIIPKEPKDEILEKIEKLEKNYKILTEPNPKGLDNIGATCYMNATLQSLYNISKLSEYFLEKYKEDKNKKMANEYYTVVKNLSKKNDAKSYAPHSFKTVLSRESPLFEGVNANDSKDLINFLIERFHQELNEIETNKLDNNQLITQQDQLNEKKMLDLFLIDFKAKFNSVISNLFYGMMETKSKCQGCNSIKYNFQVFSFLEFPLEQVNKYCYTYHLRDNYTSNNNSNPDVDLYECFNYYGHLDLMNGENQMYCNICKRNCDAFYQTNLYSLPNYLIINLNRGKGAVYQCKVNFPEKLNLLNFVTYQDGNTYFELYAVICHHGPSSMSGHFIAYCKNKIEKNGIFIMIQLFYLVKKKKNIVMECHIFYFIKHFENINIIKLFSVLN